MQSATGDLRYGTGLAHYHDTVDLTEGTCDVNVTTLVDLLSSTHLKDKVTAACARPPCPTIPVANAGFHRVTPLCAPQVIDLIDVDIQNAEIEVFDAVLATPTALRNVRRIHIGTHSELAERTVIRVFTELGWAFKNIYRGTHGPANPVANVHVPFPECQFLATIGDGVFTVINPAFPFTAEL